MKIVFLDFDGVLNNQLWFTESKGLRECVNDCIDPKNIERLNVMIRQTDADVVVSSTWRLSRTVSQLQDVLENHGFIGEVIGKTEDLRRGEDGDCILRGNEILHWIKKNKRIIGVDYYAYKEYVILDDDSDMLHWQRNNFIHVDPYVGLTPRDVEQAIKILCK